MNFNFKNISKYLLVIFYPLFISLLIEYNVFQSFYDTLNFLNNKPNILLFSIIFSAVLFIIVLFLCKKSFLAITIHSITFYILSCIEYFKYKTSGSHLIISDLLMTKNIGDVGKFASIEITYQLVITFLILLLYIYLSYKNNIDLKIQLKSRVLLSAFITLFLVVFLATPLYTVVLSSFKIETSIATNILESNEQFNDIGFLPYLTKTTSEDLLDTVDSYDDYNEESINSLLIKSSTLTSDSSNNKKPNVVFIMSESFSDFRNFPYADVSNDIYKELDEVKSEGLVGNCIVPTFGGYTTRTEFELLVGLPTYALNTPSIPQNLLKDQAEIETIPSYFKDLGYSTNYIHPFSKTFYDRDVLYLDYGFDNLYFDDNMTVNTENFRRYISDESVFNQIKMLLQESDSPSYIFATTMQNHQPYYEDEAEGADQLSYYLAGIKETSHQLRELTNWLKDFDEDTILVFVGDHYPFFTPDDNVYDRIGLTDTNSKIIYNQNFIIWNNYDSSILDRDTTTISSFYIPYLLIDLINSKEIDFIATMKELMTEYPLYSPSIQSSDSKNKALDLLTYDRVLGEMFSK